MAAADDRGQLLSISTPELPGVWGEDETIGWVYQYFNGADERRRCARQSQAPRNSRELAVRNQFFTPRYVVQFLTDNTLGRIWYEMRDTDTALAERCDYLVRRPGAEFTLPVKKDPRDLRVLDPACGSGHFLLYAFDLLTTIYEEAHSDADSPRSEATGTTLAEEYPDIESLRRALPGLILQHNLYGVDIDGRCVQIAQLALWLRAQSAYQVAAVDRAERPPIRRSNVIVAEPLVADEEAAKEFLGSVPEEEQRRAFQELISSLALAGDLGLLLRVEMLRATPLQSGYAGDLFISAEERLYEALDRYAAEQATRAAARRRLFADDTYAGLGLISTATQKYDVVLMNPPFGDATGAGRAAIAKLYPRSKISLRRRDCHALSPRQSERRS